MATSPSQAHACHIQDQDHAIRDFRQGRSKNRCYQCRLQNPDK